jgi:nitrogen-specific signal transduction histidine kinase/CheY-like chemotaxis protein
VAVDNARSYELAKKAVEEISEAERLKTQFLANMSHELRTPLNSIIGFSRVILKGIDGPVTEQQVQDLNAIYNSGQHLLGLINDVLDLSKIEAGKMEMALVEDVNLAEIVHSVMSTTVGLVKDKPIQLKQNLSPDLPRLTVDPMKIRQVLINLLSNAAKFTEKGTITVEAHLLADSELAEYKAKTPSVIVRVIDTGAGIAPADQVKLFQPFSQVDGSLTRKTGGSGLGLSICQHLIRMHGGEIGLDKRVTQGSVFYFTLPLTPAEKIEATPAGASEPSPLAPQAAGSEPISGESRLPQAEPDPLKTPGGVESPPGPDPTPRQVLVIEQDPQLTDIYRRYLAGHNCSVLALTELDQVLSVARILQPYAITLDVTMQGAASRPPAKTAGETRDLDGWKILQALKSDPATQAIPVIVCSVVAQQERALGLGASDYLLKPILQEDLIHALERIQR